MVDDRVPAGLRWHFGVAEVTPPVLRRPYLHPFPGRDAVLGIHRRHSPRYRVAARITDPHSHLDKVYHVHVGQKVSDAICETLTIGICDGAELLRAKRASVLRGGSKNTWLEIVLDEGKNRQIRRIFDYLGIEVLRLVRVSIGPLALGQLDKGQYRELSAAEKSAMDRALGKSRGADKKF